MFFEEKYGDVVRVVQIFNPDLPEEMHQDDNEAYFSGLGNQISIELCGGTHVSNTKDIGAFTIISQEAVASGIKRITALTGPRVIEKLGQQNALLFSLTQTLDVVSAAQLPEKATKLMKELTDAKSQLTSFESQLIRSFLISGDKASNADFDVIMKAPIDMNFKVLGNEARQFFGRKNVLLATTAGTFLILTQAGNSAKALAQKLGLKGGGNDQQVQGRDSKVVELI